MTDVNKKDEGAKKKAANEMLAEEDKGDSMEESMAKIEQKCKLKPGRLPCCNADHVALLDETPKNPLVFCHGLLGFDYLGPASLPPSVRNIPRCDAFLTPRPDTASKSPTGEESEKSSRRTDAKS